MGFSAELSGKQSELAINLRHGLQLAVEEINDAAGINGRQIELLVEDDHGTPQGIEQAELKLIESGVVAIIGPLTSNQTVEGYKVTEAKGVLLLSATASTSILSGKKDLFFRTTPTTDFFGNEFARYIGQQRKLSRLAIIYDQDNNTYAEPMMSAFAKNLSSLGGQVINQIKFSAAASPDFAPPVDELQASNPDGVFIIAAPPNAAMIAQQIRLKGWSVPLFAAPWAQGENLLQIGGKAVEGMEIIIPFDINNPSPALRAFKTRYQARFAHPPVFTAMYGYETMQMLAIALEKTGGKATGLPQTLLELGDFEGLSGPIRLDEYGDAVRPLYIQRIRAGKFETIETLSPVP